MRWTEQETHILRQGRIIGMSNKAIVNKLKECGFDRNSDAVSTKASLLDLQVYYDQSWKQRVLDILATGDAVDIDVLLKSASVQWNTLRQFMAARVAVIKPVFEDGRFKPGRPRIVAYQIAQSEAKKAA